ncbi:MAG: trimeric intracellular cation channel family protein [Pseudomonadota bacterium]
MTAFELLDAIGVFVFALSGGLAASRQKMDFFGIGVVALLPAIGGGTLRDLLLDREVFWLQEPRSILVALAAAGASYLIGERIARFKTLLWFDAAGMALFAVTGAAVAFEAGYGPIIVVMMGTMTASFGGLLRDIVCNEIPLILREDIYATAALIGAGAYRGAETFGAPDIWPLIIGFGVAFGIRAAVLIMRDIRPRLERSQLPANRNDPS